MKAWVKCMVGQPILRPVYGRERQCRKIVLAMLLSDTVLCLKLSSPVQGNRNCLLVLVLADLHQRLF